MSGGVWGEQVGEEESVVFGLAAVIEGENELAAVLADPLQRMRQAGRKILKSALADIFDIGAPCRVDGRHPHRAVGDIGPLCRLMPMQLADAARLLMPVIATNAVLRQRQRYPRAAFAPRRTAKYRLRRDP